MTAICATVMVIISEVLFWKLLEFSYVQSSVSVITRRIDNGIWNIRYSWRCYGHGSTYMLIFYPLNIMKRKLAKLIWKLSVAQKSEPVLWRALHQDNSLITALFFGSRTNLVFKFNLVLNTFCHKLFTFTFRYYLLSWSPSSASMLFFYNNQKSFDEAKCHFFKVSSQKTFLLCSYFPWNICTWLHDTC